MVYLVGFCGFGVRFGFVDCFGFDCGRCLWFIGFFCFWWLNIIVLICLLWFEILFLCVLIFGLIFGFFWVCIVVKGVWVINLCV